MAANPSRDNRLEIHLIKHANTQMMFAYGLLAVLALVLVAYLQSRGFYMGLLGGLPLVFLLAWPAKVLFQLNRNIEHMELNVVEKQIRMAKVLSVLNFPVSTYLYWKPLKYLKQERQRLLDAAA